MFFVIFVAGLLIIGISVLAGNGVSGNLIVFGGVITGLLTMLAGLVLSPPPNPDDNPLKKIRLHLIQEMMPGLM